MLLINDVGKKYVLLYDTMTLNTKKFCDKVKKKYFWKSGALEVQFSIDMRGGDYGIREQGRFSSLPLREDS